jgi:hypothetical protein
MERFGELTKYIEAETGISIHDIVDIVVLNDFSSMTKEVCQEEIKDIISAIESGLNFYRGELIKTAGSNINYDRNENVEVIEQNIKSLEEFMIQALYAERAINYAITGEKTDLDYGKTVGPVPEELQQPESEA